MSITLDARGLSCPQPVLMTLKAMKEGKDTELLVLVDNETAKENVSRAVRSQKWHIASIEERDGVYQLVIKNRGT
ncbi:MAG: sulfurtransferase TusA family protein [Syntrophales bacterium]|nr:sulfurtransferase TusA family protein [Syntrophales bacterium]